MSCVSERQREGVLCGIAVVFPSTENSFTGLCHKDYIKCSVKYVRFGHEFRLVYSIVRKLLEYSIHTSSTNTQIYRSPGK